MNIWAEAQFAVERRWELGAAKSIYFPSLIYHCLECLCENEAHKFQTKDISTPHYYASHRNTMNDLVIFSSRMRSLMTSNAKGQKGWLNEWLGLAECLSFSNNKSWDKTCLRLILFNQNDIAELSVNIFTTRFVQRERASGLFTVHCCLL